MNKTKRNQLILLIIGIGIYSFLIYKADPLIILDELNKLGFHILIVLVPYLSVLALDTLGWNYVIISANKTFNLFQLLKVKLAGDFVNNVTPAGSIAGEPVKAHILKRYGVSFIEGIASVYMGRLLMAKGQALFIILGLILGFGSIFKMNQNLLIGTSIALILLLSILGITYYFGAKKGFFNFLLTILEAIKLNFSFIEKQREQLNLLDERISHFYKNHKKEFILSILSFFGSWLSGAIELYLILYFLNSPISFSEAIIVESFGTIIRSAAFFIPGGLGAIDYGYFWLITNIAGTNINITTAYTVIRRIRELLWVGVGVFFLSQFDLELPGFLKRKKVIDIQPSNSELDNNNH